LWWIIAAGELNTVELGKASHEGRGEGISRTSESGFLISEMRRWWDEMLAASEAQIIDEFRWFICEGDTGAFI
jgi:hypothetical protein